MLWSLMQYSNFNCLCVDTYIRIKSCGKHVNLAKCESRSNLFIIRHWSFIRQNYNVGSPTIKIIFPMVSKVLHILCYAGTFDKAK